jgi:transcriptional regulator with XRE-family HTH domain
MTEPTQKKDDSGYDSRAIGQRMRLVRNSRGKTLAVIAGLAGISEGYLSRIECGEKAIDSWSLLLAIANALRVAPSDLTSLPVPAPANGHTDSSIEAARLALLAVTDGQPGGEVQSVEQLRYRYQELVGGNFKAHGDFKNRGAVLPGLIADLHMTLAQRRQMAELLPLAVVLHAGPVGSFLANAGASTDLRWQNVMLARRLAEELDDPIMLGFVVTRSTGVLRGSGAFNLARARLDATTVPTATNEGRQVSGILALNRSQVAAGQGRPAEAAAALEHAGELAARITGDPFTTGFGPVLGFSPVHVGVWRVATPREYGDPDEAIRVARTVNPQEHRFPIFQAMYWMNYGRALTSVRRRDDAARAMLRAETLHPTSVLRNPFNRDTLMELATHAKDNALGREIRGMAHRAGLPV